MQANAKARDARISFKKSIILAKALRRKKVSSALQLLRELKAEKKSLKGKYYTKTTDKFLEVLLAAEANAKKKNLNTDRLFIKIVKANKGYKFIRPRSRFGLRGTEAKMTNLEIIVEER
jgi:ribosomal protein L22